MPLETYHERIVDATDAVIADSSEWGRTIAPLAGIVEPTVRRDVKAEMRRRGIDPAEIMGATW